MRIPGPALLLPLFLAGCGLPPAVTVATLVVDGFSYVATGKGPADHAISAFVHEDCALHRVVEEGAICDPDGDVLIALVVDDPANENWYRDPETGLVGRGVAQPWDSPGDLEATAEPPVQLAAATGGLDIIDAPAATMPARTPALIGQVTEPREPAMTAAAALQPARRGALTNAQPAAKPPQPQRPASPAVPATSPDAHSATFAVIGSYRVVANARRAAESRGEDVLIQTTVVDGNTTYRVLLDRPVEQARNDGFSDAWPVRLCADDLGSPPCGHFVVSQAGVYLETDAN